MKVKNQGLKYHPVPILWPNTDIVDIASYNWNDTQYYWYDEMNGRWMDDIADYYTKILWPIPIPIFQIMLKINVG